MTAIYNPLHKSYYEKLPFGIPNNWIWCKLGEVCNVVRGGSPRPAGSNIYYNGDIPFLKVADLTKSKNMYVDTYQYTIKEAGLTKTRFIKKDTLLLTNSGATLGVPKICGIDATINDGIAAFLDLDDSQIEYLYWFLESQTQNMRNIDQGAAQPNLNTDIIKDFLIPIPPLTEQKRIVSEIKYLLSVIDSLEENKISLEQFISQTKSKILDLAIRGKLVPQDPNDEPASVLLERIKSERSDSKKKAKNTGDNSH
ncbi:MAG: restriction endonuclease subunit S, partial [Niabella sp.]